ncbi:hypothetical protein [Companilactobacillus sp.]|uniref:Lreu_0056 family protein n=1 Tax=Companilactobacillus sp. TaxID=2767905 RepID=UPI00261D7FEE|nr:hypothetical protein [Companilactobacillus sp.]
MNSLKVKIKMELIMVKNLPIAKPKAKYDFRIIKDCPLKINDINAPLIANNGLLMAALTRNEKVASNFNAIATGDHQQTKSSGESSSSSKNTKSNSLERDPKLVGVMIYQYGHKISMDSDFASSLMFGPYEDKYSVSGGSGTSGLQFRIDGNTVTYWMLDPNSSDVDADKTQMEASVSLSQLENKYYATSAQKQEVKSYANEFRSLNN